MNAQNEFDIAYLRLLYEQKAAEVKQTEQVITARRRALSRKHKRTDEHLALLQYGYGILRQELADITDRLQSLGVQMELTRARQPYRKLTPRDLKREHERNRLEGMMRGNYNRYNGS